MSTFLKDYHAAYKLAATEANRLRHSFGIEKTTEYGSKGFRVYMIPKDSAKRFGRDYTCEAVEPGSPVI